MFEFVEPENGSEQSDESYTPLDELHEIIRDLQWTVAGLQVRVRMAHDLVDRMIGRTVMTDEETGKWHDA